MSFRCFFLLVCLRPDAGSILQDGRTELEGRAFTDTRGYSGTENVFEDGYKKPVVGHWVASDDQGHLKWIPGKEYVATYGTDSVTKGLFLGHTKRQIRIAPSL